MRSAHGMLAMALVCALGACGDDAGSDEPGEPDAGPPEVDAGGGPPTVTIDDGRLEGEIDGESRRFLGIPYAAPPVGPLRWKAPEPNQPWEGVRDATEFGAACAQPPSLQAEASENEDCLYLNVWTP